MFLKKIYYYIDKLNIDTFTIQHLLHLYFSEYIYTNIKYNII